VGERRVGHIQFGQDFRQEFTRVDRYGAILHLGGNASL
jgi:hypothetical protein